MTELLTRIKAYRELHPDLGLYHARQHVRKEMLLEHIDSAQSLEELKAAVRELCSRTVPPSL